jgi:hypothetical protein
MSAKPAASKVAATKQRSVIDTDDEEGLTPEASYTVVKTPKVPKTDAKESKLLLPHQLAVGVGQGSRLRNTTGGKYVIKFRYAGSLDTTGSGTGFAAAPWDVSAAADFSSAAALFAECKVVAAQIEAATQQIASSSNVRCYMGLDYSVTNTAPASEGAVLQLEDLKLFSASVTIPIKEHRKIGQMAWAACSSPVPGPYAGLYGQWSLCAVGTNSTGAFNYLVTVWVEFRGRK